VADRCPITGTAAIVFAGGGRLEWTQADPEIHVEVELLEDLDEPGNEDGRSLLYDTYEIGESCPYRPGTRHARLRPPVPDQEADHG
jgi:hypothetical protein